METESSTNDNNPALMSASMLLDDVIKTRDDIAQLISRLNESKKELQQLEQLLATQLKIQYGLDGVFRHKSQTWAYSVEEVGGIPLQFRYLKTITIIDLENDSSLSQVLCSRDEFQQT